MKIFIRILKAGIVLAGIAFTIMFFSNVPGMYKIWSYLATLILPFAVDFIRIFGLKVSEKFEIAYLLFLLPAMIFGIDLDWYKLIPPFDKIVHGLSGVLAAYGAREIILQASGKPDKLGFKVMFSISFVAFTAVAWECTEFLIDQVAGTNMQELLQCGTADTMYDMIVALAGGIVGTFLAFTTFKKPKRKAS